MGIIVAFANMNERSIGDMDAGRNVEAIVLVCCFFNSPDLK